MSFYMVVSRFCRQWFLFILIKLVLVDAKALASSSKHEHGENEEGHHKEQQLDVEAVKRFGLSTQKAEGGVLDIYLTLLGRVELHPDFSLHLHPKYPGIVREVYKSIGDKIKPGDVLARVENNVGIQIYPLTSTISGVVLDRRVAPGQSVDESIESFTVADTSKLRIAFVASPRDLVKLVVGQTVVIKDSKVGVTGHSKINFISPILEENTRRAKIYAPLDNADSIWRPGQYALGTIAVEQISVSIRIPIALVEEGGGEATLYVQREGKFIEQQLALGRRDESYVEVLSGLLAGEDYIAASSQEVSRHLEGQGEHEQH